MKINNFLLIVLFVLIIPIGSSALCQNVNPLSNVPCDIVTPVLSCSGNAQLSNINTSINYTVPMSSLGDGTYKIIFNYAIGEYYIILCDNSTTSFSVTPISTTTPTYYPSNPPSSTGIRRNVRNVNYTIAVQVSQYPYVDINQSTTFYVEILQNMTSVSGLNNTLIIRELNGSNSSINIPYNVGNGIYQVSILFDGVGDYPFDIYTNGTGINTKIASGTLIVRNPFYVYVRLFNEKDLSDYYNNYGYVTAEYTNSKKLNPTLEPFFYPIKDSTYKSPVFHANYIDGTARLKLFENATTYTYRFMDGVTFNTTYDVPTPEKLARTEMFLGSRYTNSSTLIQFVLSEKDKHPYRWLLNWIVIIGLIFTAIISIGLFFVIPDKPQIALVFGLIFTVMLIVGRVILYIWRGW